MNCYTYLIGWSLMGIYYYGAQYRNMANPKDLWVKYFTSSKTVKIFRSIYGEPDIIQIRRTFGTNRNLCLIWETKVLRRMKAKTNPKFLNLSENAYSQKDKNSAKLLELGIHNFQINHPMHKQKNKDKISESNVKRRDAGTLNFQYNNPMKNPEIARQNSKFQKDLVEKGIHWTNTEEWKIKHNTGIKNRRKHIYTKEESDRISIRMTDDNPMKDIESKIKNQTKHVKRLISIFVEYDLKYETELEWNNSIEFIKNNRLSKLFRNYQTYLRYKEYL